MTNPPTINQFKHEAANTLPPLLAEGEPSVCTIVKGTSPVIILGPHNGFFVPKSLHDEQGRPLGMPHAWFDPESNEKRHEACDWGMRDLFSALQESEHSNTYNYLSCPYSRLICDLNRTKDECITYVSSEDGETEIIGNKNLSAEQIQQRIDTIHVPYRQAIKDIIAHARTNCGGAVVLDLHSFSPIWNGTPRDIQIGTITFEDNIIQQDVTKFLAQTCEENALNFGEDEPYDHQSLGASRTEPAQFIESCGARYIGIEIRNDLLQTAKTKESLLETTT